MKRRNAILFVLTLLLSMVCTFALASCEEHVHTFSTEWSSDDTSHWHASTCEHTDEKSDVAEHDWDEGTETTPATETAKGVMTYTCKVCEKTKTEEIPVLAHTHTYSDVLTYDADGHYYPSTCGHSDAKKDYTAHDFDDGVVTPPTCTEDGYTTYTCACGYSYQGDTTEATDHDWEIVDHNNNGTHNVKCANDASHTDTVSCEYTTSVTPPTCTEDGYTTYTCACGYSYQGDTTEATDHDWEIVGHNNDGTHNLKCANDESHTKKVSCEYTTSVTPPTCTEDGYTTYTCACGYSYQGDTTEATDHDWAIVSSNGDGTHDIQCRNDASHTDTVACEYDSVVTDPTCTEDGYTTYTCDCGHSYQGDTTEATDHDWEIVGHNNDGTHNLKCANDESHTKKVSCEYTTSVTPPTCTEDGYTTYTCACGYSRQGNIIPALDHDYGDWEYVGDNQHARVCANDEDHVETKSCEYDDGVVTAPTCEEQGYTTYTCEHCEHSYQDDFVDALDHDYGDWEYVGENQHARVCANDEDHVETKACEYVSVVTAPTCEEQGYTTYTCKYCEHSYKDNYVNALNHDYGDWESDNDGTHSRVCANDENHVETKTCEYVSVVTAPTCTENGYTTYTCEICEYHYTANETEATGHSYNEDEWTIDDAYHYHASTCGCADEMKNYELHAFTIFVETVDPTCETEGYTTYKCKCGATQNRDTVEATGHSYGKPTETGRVATGDSCTWSVTYQATCATCSKPYITTKTEEFHSFYTTSDALAYCTATGNDVACSATCQSGGVTHKHCSVEGCKYYATPAEITRTDVDPNAHVWDDGTTDGNTTTYTCECGVTKKSVSSDNGSVTVGGDVDEVVLGDTTINMNGAMKDKVSGSTIETGTITGNDKETIINNAGVDPELVGDKPIYSFTLNGGDADDFGTNGEATITLPYELGETEDPNNIIVWYVADGELVAYPATYSEDADGNGSVTFVTSHFSYYIPASVAPEQLCGLLNKHSDNVHTVEATCTTDGYTVCLRCKEVIETIPALGHKFVSTVTKESTCTENGKMHYACAECDMAYDVTLSATGHYHVIEEHIEASCMQQGRTVKACIYCDDELVITTPKLMHGYVTKTVAPTCTERGYTQRTCTLCGDVQVSYVASLGHSFGVDWESAEEGHYHVCSVCGERDKVVAHIAGAEATEEHAQLCETCSYVLVPQLAHVHKNMTQFEANAPTCTQSGNKAYYVCSCGKWFLDEKGVLLITDHTSVILDATGHTNETIDYLAPTCTQDGHTAGVKCSVCDTLLRGNITISKTGHDYAPVVTKPTCVNGGYTTFTCAGCGDSYRDNETVALGHRYASVITAPTCITGGYTTYTCMLCRDSYEGDFVSALGHNYRTTWSTDENGHWHDCTRCDAINGYVAHIKDYESATESHGVSCVICRYEIEPMRGHTHAVVSSVAHKDATCMASGNVAYYICACGEWFYDENCVNIIYNRASVIIPSTGHSLVYHKQVNPTCSAVGYTAGYFCTVCNDYISGRVEIPESDHSYTVPKYNENGHWYQCASCHATSSIENHEYTQSVTAPTCSLGGYTVFTCECGYEYVGAQTPANGHDFGDWVSNYDGTHTRVCSVDPRHIQTAVCEYSDEVVAPTCTARGYTLHTCECGHSYTDSFVKAKGHTYGALEYNGDGTHVAVCINDASHVQTFDCHYLESVTEPTCENDGYTTFTCDCGHSYVGDLVDAYGHDFGVWSSNGNGTHTRICANDENHIETVACVYTMVVVAPTCEDDGYTVYTCECGYTYNGDIVGALGHNYNQVISNYDGTHTLVCEHNRKHTVTATCEYSEEITEPTCENEGYTTFTCDCGHSYVGNYTNALGHSFGEWEYIGDGMHACVCMNNAEHIHAMPCSYAIITTAPTCTEQGYTTYTCVCGHSYVDNYVNATGHDYVDGVCGVCGEEEPFEGNTIIVSKTIGANDTVTVTLTVKKASFAGIRLRIAHSGYTFLSAECPEMATYHDTGDNLQYVISSGENVMSDTIAIFSIEFTVEPVMSADITIDVMEIYEFGENGELIVPQYSVVYAN